jgi:hypothetical protein
MQTYATNSLSDFLNKLATDLSDTLRRAARAAERIEDPDASLPPVLHVKDIAVHRRVSTTTVWRKARLGEYGRLLSKPGEPIAIRREDYLRSLEGDA